MGRYTMIADTGERLVKLLQRELVPEVIENADEIGLRSPEEHGDVSLGLFLFDVRESDEIRQVRPVVRQENRMARPPIYLNLFYMVTAYCNSDIKFRLPQEERILGKVIQTFHDYPVLPLGEAYGQEEGVDIRIQMIRMEVNERFRIWQFPGVGNRLSLFYKVAPVAIDSSVTTEFGRVVDVNVNVSDIINAKGK